MDWGFGNPNKTAALITLLMLAVWALSYIRKWGFWAALVLFTGLGACLILTQSRGGLIGIIVGSVILIGWGPRPLPFGRSIAVFIVCIGLIVFAFAVKAESRYTKGLLEQDRSIENRLLIWKEVPTMIRDAPNGWGLGKSGDAYMQWYQPIARSEGYRTLVNSHLTWLTELNWWGKMAYIASWTVALVLLWPTANTRWFAIPFAIWIAWGICASFSSVAETLMLWIIPLTALIWSLMMRFQERIWPKPILWLGSAAVLILGGAAVFIFEPRLSSSIIYCPQEGIVTVGPRSPEVWIVAPDRHVLGEHYGHEIRRAVEEDPVFKARGVGVGLNGKNIPRGGILIYSGQLPPDLKTSMPSEIILINPIPSVVKSLDELPEVVVVVGEYSPNKNAWSDLAHSHSNIKIQVVEGSEEYIPEWMNQVARAIKWFNQAVAVPRKGAATTQR